LLFVRAALQRTSTAWPGLGYTAGTHSILLLVVRRHVDQRRALPDPLLLGRRLVGDHVLAEVVVDLPAVAPVRRVAVLQPEDLRRGLEKVWDAFERIKTLEPVSDKRAQVTALLDKATQAPRLRAYLENEAKELTVIGNNLQIRHFEKTQEKLDRPEEVDYLFHRMFSFIRLVLRATGREG
jgi:hypothetical protein